MEDTTSDPPAGDAPAQPNITWTKLSKGKELSRLLYPNPVCFLCTGDKSEPNVMVLSWLTATNNEGRFLFSINKYRHSATLLQRQHLSNEEFVLSVPVHGMETLLRHVGSVSGGHANKFPAHVKTSGKQQPNEQVQKKTKRYFPNGIPGLRALLLQQMDRSNEDTSSKLFGIDGCVAFIVCQIHQILENSSILDDAHLLVVADMKRAWVHPDYWCSARNRFLPASDQIPSYLTFLGSQTFGQIVVRSEEDE